MRSNTEKNTLRLEALQSAKKVLLSRQQPGDDYRELLELTIIFPGDVPPYGIRLTDTGALHRAR
jgi:hypothetical protein